MMKLRNLKGCK